MILRTLAALVIATAILVPTPNQAQTTDAISDPYGRTTPRGTVDGYLKAMREADPAKATVFMDLRNLPPAEGQLRAMQLKQLLDDGGYFLPTDEISAAPDGNLDDEMSADLEEVGALHVGRQEVPVLLQRLASEDGSYVWLFTRQTVEMLPELSRRRGESLLDQILPQDLKTRKIMTVPVGHWLALVIVAILAVMAGLLLARLALRGLEWLVTPRIGAVLNVRSVALPLGIVIAVAAYRQAVVLLGVQIVARGATDWIAVTALWLGVAVLALKLVDLVAEALRAALHPADHRASLAALILLRKIVKALILAVLAVQVLEILGFDVTTAIAALGIGGLALALGAQKTVENLVGSVNIVADQPVEVGDFCKFNDISGTVEDIGIRSTRIRTQARTVVTVPNGALAAMQIENFTVRDRFLFNTVVSIRPNISIKRLNQLLGQIRRKLETSDNVAPGARANLVDMTRTSLEIEIFAYLKAPDYLTFLNDREALLVFLLKTLTANGQALAFPPSLVQLTATAPASWEVSP